LIKGRKNSPKEIPPSSKKTAMPDPSALKEGQKNFIFGFEGCICKIQKSRRNEGALLAEEIPGAREWINQRFDEGHFICFLSSLREKHRNEITSWLNSHGFKYNSLILGKPEAISYHYVDDRHVQATKFNGRYSPLVRKNHRIQVFS
jgi:hypothetical protein